MLQIVFILIILHLFLIEALEVMSSIITMLTKIFAMLIAGDLICMAYSIPKSHLILN